MLLRNVAYKMSTSTNSDMWRKSIATILFIVALASNVQAAVTTHKAQPPTKATLAYDVESIDPTALIPDTPTASELRQKQFSNNEDLIASSSANLLLEGVQQPATATGQVVNITRFHEGDVFRSGGVANCNMDTCVGLSSGTAGLLSYNGLQNDAIERIKSSSRHQKRGGGRYGVRGTDVTPIASGNVQCQCRCLPYLSTYREDLGICVDDIHECTLSPFVSGSSSEKIPFVFLPLRGQIIYPSREISFPDIRTPVCAVTGAQYLTSNGWSDLRNPIDTDYPFRMFRDEGRTFLQWLGEADLRHKMQGRLIVVHLVCRDMTISLNATNNKKDQLKPPQNVFSPCVAFRVNGSPVKYFHNVSEVSFQSEATTTLASTSDGMSTKEYVVIGVCSLLLGLIYVSSVFLYLHMKKRKTRDQSHRRNSIDDLANEINYPKNDQVTFGAPFNRVGSIYSATSLGTSNEQRSRASLGSLKDDIGIVKNNPLLQHYPQLSDHHSGFASDISNSNSECEMDGNFHDKIKQLQTAALVHPQLSGNNGSTTVNGKNDDSIDSSNLSSQENECLPIENVSIVEDMLTEEKLENLRAMVNGNVRKKLYFNPAYFEPHLLMQPPPAAIEFLQKIREVIAIAKYKMASKRFQPSLIMIPEEGNMRSTTPSIYGSNAAQPSAECQGCANNRCSGHVKNCGDKRNSIEKWLETVTNTDEEKSMGMKNKQLKMLPAIKEDSISNKRNSPRKEITSPKHRPPPPPVPNTQKQQMQALFSQDSKDTAQAVSAEIVHAKFMQKVSIPVSHGNFSAMSAAVNLYGFCGSDIYNNPKFNLHDSPNASQRSRGSNASQRSKSPKKRLDVLEQYATASTPTSLNSMDRQHYNMLRNMQQQQILADNNYDFNGSLKSNASFHLNIPTPDYDSTMEKKIRDIYNNSSGPSVPTPDYSTLSKKSLRQYQPPDSPIYRRKSPQYLIVDYETDSLERMEATKRKSSHSSSSPSSDVSSQLSPSLSTALPLEEELEISHTVYDKSDAFRRDDNSKNKLPGKMHKQSEGSEVGNRIKYDTPFRGSMTIEVEHEPQSDLERSTDSDQFEPDTLDRKPKKHSFCDLSAWSSQIKNSPPTMHSLPDMNREQFESLPPTYTNVSNSAFVLRPRSSSFNKPEKPPPRPAKPAKSIPDASKLEDVIRPNFGSLRELYEAQVQLSRQNSQSSSCRCGNQLKATHPYDNLSSEQGRLLTLEAKHTRRQKKIEIPPPPPPPVVEITKASANKTTIKISTPKVSRAVNGQVKKSPISKEYDNKRSPMKANNDYYEDSKNCQVSTPNSTNRSTASKSKIPARSQPPQGPPPPPPPTTSASTTLNSQKSQASNGRNNIPVYINHNGTSNTEDDTISYKSESTEVTRISDTLARSENDSSCHNTLEPKILDKLCKKMEDIVESAGENEKIKEKLESPILPKKLHTEKDFEAIFNTKINGLRTDYSLTKYMNRRKISQTNENEQDIEEQTLSEAEAQLETNNNNNNLKNIDKMDVLDVLSISSISNRSSSRLSDRTKEMYRNAGVPVGIAYPQRSSVGSATTGTPTTNVQTVYRCEIEPVQLTHGMQIAMGLRDRAKKTKDLKNAWKKFVNMAASKFSPTHSPAPPFDKKTTILEALERDEGIASLIEEQPQVSSPKNTPAQQNYYEQRFGTRLQEMDSGYMSADSGELYRRSLYDRYNFKLKSGRDQIIRVDTIDDNSERGSSITDVYNTTAKSSRRNSVIENERFEDLENIGGPPAHEFQTNEGMQSDADSDKTITHAQKRRSNKSNFVSEDGHSPSCGSSETDGETNGEDMWESGAESIETHSVLYKNIRKH